MKVAVFGTRKYDQDCLEEMNKDGSQSYTFIDAFLSETTVKLAGGHDAVCLFVNDTCDAAIIEQLHKLGVKYIALRCAGFNNVDLEAAEKFNIHVVRVPAYSPEAVAEFAVGMILTIVRKYHKAHNRVREGNFLLDGLVGFNISGKTVGVIGTGKIGLLAGRILAKGFQANVIAYDPYPSEVAGEYGITYVDTLDELLERSDIITLHCPLAESTKYIINDHSISKMKKGVVWALIKGLKSNHIGAVGLDVYERESEYFFADSSSKVITDDAFARLLSFYNVYMTGHQAFLTREALNNIAETTSKNLKDLEEKGTSENIVKKG
ncbi:D-lactate dehydrogenase [Coprinopsis sp. MPI-PUGE-AT-0042]|nr:D-lactate dehydrogenase [Coprinopsis sp. MPI-PUGE-AT-0042]